MVKDESKIIGRFRLIGIPQGHLIVDNPKYLKSLKWFDIDNLEEEVYVPLNKFFYLIEV